MGLDKEIEGGREDKRECKRGKRGKLKGREGKRV